MRKTLNDLAELVRKRVTGAHADATILEGAGVVLERYGRGPDGRTVADLRTVAAHLRGQPDEPAELRPPVLAVEVQYHFPDQSYAAGLLRDGRPWILGGACVGLGDSPGEAVTDLLGIAHWLCEAGENALTTEPLSPADRAWLLSVLAPLTTESSIVAAHQAAWRASAPRREDG